MASEPYAVTSVSADPARSPAHAPSQHEPNEQVLRLMQSLGIDPIKTKEVENWLFNISDPSRLIKYFTFETLYWWNPYKSYFLMLQINFKST